MPHVKNSIVDAECISMLLGFIGDKPNLAKIAQWKRDLVR